MNRSFCQILTLAAVLALASSDAMAQGATTGTISGRVTDAQSQAPVPDAQVIIVGTQRGTRSGNDGVYRLGGIEPGMVRLRVLRLGYEARLDSVRVDAAAQATLDFVLTPTVTRLDQVTISATGESERRRESGNSVASINVDSVPLVVVSSVNDLLSSRAANVVVTQTNGATGTGSRIRIRGSNSISLSNEPLIIIDGIRSVTDAAGSSIDIGGQNPTRLDDLNPEDIENIEIIKGPAAAALYGTAAANGVVQITTKRGRSGATRWNAYADGGSVRDVFRYPDNVGRRGTRPSGNPTIFCTLVDEVNGDCTPDTDGLMTWNPLENASPFVDGWREALGLSSSGGSDQVQFYLAGDYEREQGVMKNNGLRRATVRTNVTGQFNPQTDFAAKLAYSQVRSRLPQGDNNDLSVIANGVLGNAEDDPNQRGYLFYPVSALEQIYTNQDVDRFTTSLNGTWRPMTWLALTGITGVDYAGRNDYDLLQPDLIPAPDERNIGSRQSNPFHFWTYSANFNGTANWHLGGDIQAATSAGTQFNREVVKGTQAFGRGLASGTGSLGGTTSGFAVGELNQEIVTLGVFAQQKFAWRDRLFFSAAARGDDNSNFGQDLEFVIYPSASLSWVIGEENWFPQGSLLSTLRLRAAAGQSGQRPGFRDAVTFYNTIAVANAGRDVGGVELAPNVGNAELKPELSTEYEAGFDLGLFNGRASLELTGYHKTTRDALIQRQLPPSTGAGSRFENLGKVTNKGLEASINATLLDRQNLTWDVAVNGSTNRNELVELGIGVDTIFVGLGAIDGNFSQRFAEGHPIGGYWQRPILSWGDENSDGIIAPSEVEIGDDYAFLGSPLPKTELSFNTNLTVFGFMRLSALLDHRGGYTLYNAGEEFRCVQFLNCDAAFDKSQPLSKQAAIAAGYLGTSAGWMEDASFWKLREVAVTLSAPENWAARLNTRSLSLTLAGRNLGTWTDYTGFDPELNFNGTSNFSTAEFFTQPPVRYFTARVSVGW
jgi:TonB-linked SusC/RagA family outer membrane protein